MSDRGVLHRWRFAQQLGHAFSLPPGIRFTLAILFSVSLLCGVAALWGVHRVSRILPALVRDNVASIQAAHELQAAVLDQRGLTASYVLSSGRKDWLDEVEEKRQSFQNGLAKARASAGTPEETAILERIETAYAEYDAQREHAVEVFQRGQREEAARMILEELPPLRDEAAAECEKLIQANVAYINDAIRKTESTSRQLRWITLGSTAFTLSLGGLLAILLIQSVFAPLRQAADRARRLARGKETTEVGLPRDYLSSLRSSLDALANVAAEAQESLTKSQGELEEAQQLALVGELSTGVAHEIRNLLTTMRLWSFSLRDATIDDGEMRNSFEAMHGELSRLEQLVRGFLVVARPPELNQRRQSIRDLIEDARMLVHPRFDENRLELKVSCDGELPSVFADGGQIKQVLVNLLVNACDASRPGGDIRVAASAEPAEVPHWVAVRVSNQGNPAPPELRERIFDPFFTTKAQGVGLGLPIAAAIARRHGGELRLEQSDGRETVFTLLLPTYPESDDGEDSPG